MGLIRDHLLRRVDDVRKVALDGDYEHAHGLADNIMADALRAIKDRKNGEEDPALIAEAALRTETIDFPRYCA